MPVFWADDIRKWSERMTNSLSANLLGCRAGWWVYKGGEGGSPALLHTHLRSDCVINGQSPQISRRVCGVEESQRLKHGRGGGDREKNEVRCLLGGRKIQPLSLFLLRRSRPKGSVMIGPSGLFCLATCSGEAMIASEAEEVKRRDCQQDCTENTSQVLICHSELSQSCYCFKIVVWAATGYKSQSLKQPQPPSRSPVMHLSSLYLGFIRIMFSWLIIRPHSKSVLRVVAAYRKVHLYFTA